MNKYIYTDNNTNTIVFEYIGDDILEADKAYKEKTGKDAMKQPYVGCQIVSS